MKSTGHRENLGVVSFALLGVLIILLSIFAAVYISRIDRIAYENELRNDKISKLEDDSQNTLDTIENKIRYIGVRSAFKAGTEYQGNVSENFENSIEDYMDRDRESSFWNRDETDIKIKDHELSIRPKTVSMDMVTPEADKEKGDISNDGPGEIERKNTTFCYEVVGTINITATRDGLSLDTGRDVQLTIDVPYPFLKDKMDSFGTSLRGEKSHIARITEYILTTISQYRTLSGYGMRPLPSESEDDYESTDEILTEKDVELAVNIALLFEIAYEYRSYDQDHLDSILENTTSIKRDKMKELLATYLEGERIDPGDLISLYHGYTYDDKVISENESSDLDIPKIVGQSMNALIDQFILVHLDNLDTFGFLEGLLKGIRDVGEMFKTITDLIAGDDEDEINPEEVEVVTNWVRSIFIFSGMRDTNLFLDYYGTYNNFAGEKIEGYPSLPDDYEFKDTFTYRSKLKGEEYEWYEYSCGHGGLDRKHGDTCEEEIIVGHDDDGEPIYARCGAEEIKVANDFKEGTVEFKVTGGPLVFPNMDILEGRDALWQEFYNDYFKDSVDQDPENIEEAVKDVILEFIDELVDHDKIKEIINEYNNIEVNPSDRTSFMKRIQENVDMAIHEVIDHFRRNPDEIASLLEDKLHEEGDPKVDDLIEFLNENYDELVRGPDLKEYASLRTAVSMTDHDNPNLEILHEESEIIIGDVNEKSDMVMEHDREVNKGEASKIIQDGSSTSQSKIDSLIEDLEGPVEDIYEEVKKREIHISDSEDNISEEDGLIIQALNHYQHNTSFESESQSDPTRKNSLHSTISPKPYSRIEEISPNPATKGQHTVFFQGNTSLNYTEVEWISDKDGHLSHDFTFNQSARFMSSGEHVITFKVVGEGGFEHTDTEKLFINIPPTSKIGTISPDPATEYDEISFKDDSSDPDGRITEVNWCFGDGNSSKGGVVKHTYTQPGVYTVNLTVEDDKGGVDSDFKEILIDNAPSITEIKPDNEDERWDTYTDIKITFSEEVDPGSLAYSITPFIEFDRIWTDKNTTLILTPVTPYDRDTDYNLTIHNIEDVDNGTTSSLLEPVSIEWLSLERPSVTQIYPMDRENVKVQRSIILNLSEKARIDDFEAFIEEDWNWTYDWGDGYKLLRLNHDGFPQGTEIELNFDLSELKSRYDDSIFWKGGQQTFTLSFTTEYFDPPMLISTEPENGTELIELDDKIELYFNKPINTSSFELIILPSLENMSYEWCEDNKSVTISHDGFLSFKDYNVYVMAKCQDGLQLDVPPGKSITNPFAFKTVDAVVPRVIYTSPKDGTEHILSNTKINIRFNKEIDPESIEYDLSPYPVFVEETWNEYGTILSLDHGGFGAGSQVKFILQNANDINGNELEEGVKIEFKVSDNGEHIEGNLFQRKLWSFIGGGPHGQSFFDIAEHLLRETTANMIYSAEMSNLEYRVPLQDNFEYFPYDDNYSKEIDLMVDFEPGYIPLEDITDISDAKGHHYTDVTSISSRPFKTEWDIIVDDFEILLDIKRKTPYIMEDQVPRYFSLNESYQVGFELSISVASGWALKDVEYTRDDLDLSMILSFLEDVWDLLKRPLSYILDGLYKILELFDSIVTRLKEYAQSLIRYLGEMIEELVSNTLSNLAELILENSDMFESFKHVLSLLGLNMEVEVHEDGKEKELPNTDTENGALVFLTLDLEGSAFGTTFDLKLFVLDKNVVSAGTLSSDSMDIQWQMDPFAKQTEIAVYDSWFQSQGKFGEEGDGAILNLEIPDLKKTGEPDETSYDYSVQSLIPPLKAVSIPIGPVVVSDFDFGLEVSYIDLKNMSSSLLKGSIQTAFWESVEYMRDASINLNYIVDFVRKFAEILIEELFRFIQNIVTAIEVFFSCSINQIDVVLSFGLTAAEGIVDFIKWIGNRVRHLIQSIGNRRPSCSPASLPSSILENTELSIETGVEDAAMVKFGANVPALATLVGRDLGEWRLNFGLTVHEDLKLISGSLVQW